jgi:hypothetical protein
VGTAASRVTKAKFKRFERQLRQGFGECNPAADPDTWAGYERSFMLDALQQLAAAKSPDEKEIWTGRFLHHYLGSRDAGLLERRILQDFVKAAKISVLNAGTGELKPVANLCTITSNDQARRQARGFDIRTAPLPVIEAAGSLGLPDGSVVPSFGFSSKDLVLAPELPSADQVRLSMDERVLLLEAVISTGGGNVTADIRDALYGVISTGGGNVISTGGGNVIATGGLNLTERQKQAIQRVISTGGGTMRPVERDALGQVISTGGGNLISDKGLGLSPDVQLNAIRGVISTGGGNLNSDRLRVVQAVISTGGGNVISTGGGNVREVLQSFVNGVISTGGGNLASRLDDLRGIQSLIGQAGGNVISTGGGNLIGQAGGNNISEAGGV